MTLKEREDFNIWYDTVKSKEFDMQSTLKLYTMSDVFILISSILEFRNLILDLTKGPEIPQGFDALSCVTMGAVAYNIFLTKFLTERVEVILQSDTGLEEIKTKGLRKGEFLQITLPDGQKIDSKEINKFGFNVKETIFKSSPIGIVPRSIYKTRRNNYSKKAMEFLYFVELALQKEHSNNLIRIEHALYKGERACPISEFSTVLYLDGYCKIGEKEMVYQFHGCRQVYLIFLKN